MMKKALMIFLPLVLFGNAAVSGELKTDVRSFPASNSLPSPILTSSDLSLQGPVNNIWHFGFRPDILVAEVTMTVAAPSAGYDAFSATFRIPYFWDGSVARTLFAALAGDQLGGMGALEFLSSVGAGSQEPSELIVIHQRAARLWKERLDQLNKPGVNANRDDVRIAYWLVRSSRDLMVRQFMEVDPVTLDAMNWLQGAVQNDHLRSRLFGTFTVTSDEIISIMRTLRAQKSFLYNTVVQALERDLAFQKPGTCDRIRSANMFFSELGSDLDQYDGQFGNSVAIKTDVVLCTASELRALPTGSPALSETLEKAKTIAETMRLAAGEASSPGKSSQRDRQLAARLAELDAIINGIGQVNATRN